MRKQISLNSAISDMGVNVKHHRAQKMGTSQKGTRSGGREGRWEQKGSGV